MRRRYAGRRARSPRGWAACIHHPAHDRSARPAAGATMTRTATPCLAVKRARRPAHAIQSLPPAWPDVRRWQRWPWRRCPGAAVAQAQPAVRVASKIDTEGALLGQLIIRTLRSPRHQDREPAATGHDADRAQRAHRRRDRPLSRVHRQRRLLLRRREEPGLEEPRGRLCTRQGAGPGAPQAGVAAALAGQQHLGHRRAPGSGAQPQAEVAGRPGQIPVRPAASSSSRPRPSSSSAPMPCRPSRRPMASSCARTSCSPWPAVTPPSPSRAAAEQTSGVNAAMAYGTDGPVAALGLRDPGRPEGRAAGVRAGTGGARRGAGAPAEDRRAAGAGLRDRSMARRCSG